MGVVAACLLAVGAMPKMGMDWLYIPRRIRPIPQMSVDWGCISPAISGAPPELEMHRTTDGQQLKIRKGLALGCTSCVIRGSERSPNFTVMGMTACEFSRRHGRGHHRGIHAAMVNGLTFHPDHKYAHFLLTSRTTLTNMRVT